VGPKPSFWILTLNDLLLRSAGMTEQATKSRTGSGPYTPEEKIPQKPSGVK
jgi:hypothetical protein